MRSAFLFIAVVIGISATVGMASAGIVGVDASGGAYTGPGVLDTTSRTWELKPSTGNTFQLDGQTITMTYGTNWAGGIDAPIDLFDDYKHNNGGSAFGVVLTGLDMSKTYDLVVYGAQNFLGGRGGSFDPAEPNLPAKTTTGDQTSTFAEGVNYVRFDNVAPDNSVGDQRIRFLVGNGPEGIGIFNGFEIGEAGPPPSPTKLQYGFDYTSGTVDGNGGSVINDANPGTHDSVTIQAPGGTYSADIPTGNVQNTTGIGSLDVTGTAISTANSLNQGSGQGITTAADVFNAGGLTMEAWVKDIAATTGNPGLALNMGGMYVLGVAANGQVGFFRGDNSNDQAWTTAKDTSSWTHLAVVMETTDPGAMNYDTITAYVDGQQIHSAGHTFPWFLDRATSVGNHQYNTGWGPMDGLVYEPRVSLGALSPEDFTIAGIVPSPTILQYGFDYTSGTVDGNEGSVINDAMPGIHNSVTIQAPGGTYSADIPTANVQNATGIGSLDVTGASISTANSLGVGSGQGITTATDVYNAGGLTMEVWVKDLSAASSQFPGVGLSMGAMYVLGVAPNGQIGFFPGDDLADLSWTTDQDTSSWTHLAVVMETTDPSALSYDTITAYVDGEPIHSAGHTFPWFLDRAVSVGNHQYNLGWDPTNGLVYEPRVTLGALSPEDFTYAASVPEPSTIALFVLGGLGLLSLSRRRRK